MSKRAAGPAISSPADLFAAAYRIETDAVERYFLLADQMETHNNPELMHVFRDLARAEGLHAEEIRKLAGQEGLAERAAHIRWPEESPEEVDLSAAHYLMTPWHALQLSLAGEKRALEFFSSVMNTTNDPKIKEIAAELVEEEVEHVNLVYRLLRKYPKPPESSLSDADPPASQA
jgi:rubrerythrin